MDFTAERPVRRTVIVRSETLWLLVCVLTLSLTAAAQRRIDYANPVVPGDYPDPSVIRVGRDFWATATSSEWAPEFPLLHSRDLVNWTIVGAVFQHRPAWSVGNYWAPEISQHQGRYFIYYTARKKDGPLCVAVATALRPQGPYLDRGPLVCQAVGSIDAFPTADENGRRYLLWKEDGNSVGKPTPIWAQSLSPDGTRLIGEPHELIRNSTQWEAQLVEGPAIVRRNGWFYLFYSGNSCCGRECNYALGVARSRKLLGPWEKYPENPILSGNNSWKCPGHGTVVDTGSGRFYLLYHAYEPRNFVYVGRQALLDQVTWSDQGWPVINGGHGPSKRAIAPLPGNTSSSEYTFFDDFAGSGLQPGWQWPQTREPIKNLARANGGWLLLMATGGHEGDHFGALLARSTTAGDYTATTLIDVRGMKEAEAAGLCAFGDMENALGISVGRKTISLWRREKNQNKSSTLPASMDNPARTARVYLRMTTRAGHLYRFAISGDGQSWTQVGEEMNGSFLPPWDRGVRVGLVAAGAAGTTARFGWLRIDSKR